MSSLILASTSPRRKELLQRFSIPFSIEKPEVDEKAFWEKNAGAAVEPEELVRQLALAKANSVFRKLPDSIVIAADTIVVCEGHILGQPTCISDARKMLSSLSGRVHSVITGLAVVGNCKPYEISDTVTTLVTFRKLLPREIENYIATGEPLDKAGAYGIQGVGSLLVSRIDGCYYNVVGFPVTKVMFMLREYGIDLLAAAAGRERF